MKYLLLWVVTRNRVVIFPSPDGISVWLPSLPHGFCGQVVFFINGNAGFRSRGCEFFFDKNVILCTFTISVTDKNWWQHRRKINVNCNIKLFVFLLRHSPGTNVFFLAKIVEVNKYCPGFQRFFFPSIF